MRDVNVIYRCILPKWAREKFPDLSEVREGQFTDEQLHSLNKQSYNIFYLPNSVRDYNKNKTVNGADIDLFNYVFVDCDLKDDIYLDKETFLNFIGAFPLSPTKIIDSGNGVHVYWEISDLDAMTYLKLQRRLMRKFKTDTRTGQIYQLLRYPSTLNTKDPDNLKLCEALLEDKNIYTSEQMDEVLPPISQDDLEFCQTHFSLTYNLDDSDSKIDVELPEKFGELLSRNKEVKKIFSGEVEDRSAADFRLGHLLKKAGFTREEALSVMINVPKATERAPKHRLAYAINIVDKVGDFVDKGDQDSLDNLSSSVKDILKKGSDVVSGTRFKCYSWLDNTAKGFRLGQVLGLVAGSGVGKTAIALNMFMGFVESNPEYEHFFITLEQPSHEIAQRWEKMCGRNTGLHDKVHVISNYDSNMAFRNLSLQTIQEYIVGYQNKNNVKIGCVVIDHIGVLDTSGELKDICKEMKTFAQVTNCFLIMQSQTSREKAGIGDLELNKDAAYGTVFFESFCDYLVTAWQPLKRCYKDNKCPTVTAFKYCKIRHRTVGEDITQEDVPYTLFFEPKTERLRELTQQEEKRLDWFNKTATNLRKNDRKTELVTYTTIREGGTNDTGQSTANT